jgi:hypothetical protein
MSALQRHSLFCFRKGGGRDTERERERERGREGRREGGRDLFCLSWNVVQN